MPRNKSKEAEPVVWLSYSYNSKTRNIHKYILYIFEWSKASNDDISSSDSQQNSSQGYNQIILSEKLEHLHHCLTKR